MKKIIALFCCIAVLLCGCSKATDNNSESTKENESVSDKVTDNNSDDTSAQQKENEIKEVSGEYVSYLPVLKDTYALIRTDVSDIVVDEGQMGIVEMIGSHGYDEAFKSIGYIIKDINNDNIPELIIASVIDEYEGEYAGSRILSVYTLIDKEPSLIIEGMYRDKLFLKSDGTIYNIGSGGAAYTAFGVIELRDNGGSDYLEYYYSDIDYETGEPIYYKSTGLSTAESSKEVVSEETFSNKQDEFSADLVALELTSFYDFKNIDYTVEFLTDGMGYNENLIFEESDININVTIPQLKSKQTDYTHINELIKQDYENFKKNDLTEISYLYLDYTVTYSDSSIICILYEGDYMGVGAAHPIKLYHYACISLEEAALINIKDNINTDDEFINKTRSSVNYRDLLDYDDSTWEAVEYYFDNMTDEEFSNAVSYGDILIAEEYYIVCLLTPHASGVDYIKAIV